MCLQDRLAVRQPAQQRDGRIGEIIERQQQRGREMPVSGKHNKQPAEQQADRQAAHIAEKQTRDWTIEGRKADHCAA
jgi:hypothetical protein